MATEIKKGTFSWTSFCEQVDSEVADESTVTFLNMMTPDQLPESDGDVEHVVTKGDRLDKLARKHYGTELLWWAIAVRNDLDLPDAQMVVGRKLVIPDADLVSTRYARL